MKRLPLRSIFSRSMPRPFMRANNRPSSSSNTNSAAFSPRAIVATTKTIAERDLPVPAGPRISVLDPAAEELVELGKAARHRRPHEVAAIFQRHQPRKYIHPAGGDGRVMKTAAKFHAAVFHN